MTIIIRGSVEIPPINDQQIKVDSAVVKAALLC